MKLVRRNPTSTKLTSLANNWLTQASVKRETVFLLGFGLRMSVEDVSDFLTRVLREQDFDFHNPDEVIYWYCYYKQFGYHKAEELKKKGCDAYYFPSFEEIENFCLDKCQKGDVLITMGAGDVVNIGEHLLGK